MMFFPTDVTDVIWIIEKDLLYIKMNTDPLHILKFYERLESQYRS